MVVLLDIVEFGEWLHSRVWAGSTAESLGSCNEGGEPTSVEAGRDMIYRSSSSQEAATSCILSLGHDSSRCLGGDEGMEGVEGVERC